MSEGSEERRRAKRHVLWIPVQLTSGPDVKMLAVSRNISWSGALIIAANQLDKGDNIELVLQLPADNEERLLKGRIVRVEQNDEDPDGLWRYRLAIQFEEEVPELESVFEELSSRKSIV